MKACSLWQPWASAIILGFKQYETRSWDTTYRGPLLIHAAKTQTRIQTEICQQPWCYRVFQPTGLTCLQDFPVGMILGLVELVAVYPTEQLRHTLSPLEQQFGDYSNGRFAWKLEHIRPLKHPIPARRFQKLWEWPYALEL